MLPLTKYRKYQMKTSRKEDVYLLQGFNKLPSNFCSNCDFDCYHVLGIDKIKLIKIMQIVIEDSLNLMKVTTAF